MTSENDIAELACTYAALILHDDNVAITADKINSLLNAANVKVPPFWPGLFARVLANKNLDDLILNAGGGGAPAPSGPAPAAAAAPKEEEQKGGKGGKKEEKKEEKKKEESDEDMGFGLFD